MKYAMGFHGELVINEKEAEIVRRIYREYLEGKSYQKIADGLERGSIHTVTGNKKWWDSTVTGILTNEKERRALTVRNLVGDRNKYSSKYPFSGKVICGDCGNTFRRRTWNSTNSSKKIVWQCKTYIQKGKEVCTAKSVGEKILEKAFVDMFNRLKIDSESFIETLSKNIEKVLSKRMENTNLIEIENKIEALKEELKGLIKLQTKGQMDEEVYSEEYVRLSGELENLRQDKSKIEKGNLNVEQYKQRVAEIIKVIKEQEGLLTEFDDKIFNALVDRIEVLKSTHFVFVLKNGMRVEDRLSCVYKEDLLCYRM